MWRGALVVAVVVLVASLFGILTRPVGFLAAVWPANALLLGLLLRHPRLASPAGWIAAILAYLAADLITGGGLRATMLLTAGNLAGVATGLVVYRWLPAEARQLDRPQSVAALVMVGVAAALAAATFAGLAEPLIFGTAPWAGFQLWFVTELVNYVVILPVVLAAPSLPWPRVRLRRLDMRAVWRRALPAVALLLSLVVATWVGGVGTIAFPVPALLWCALSYRLFTVASLTAAFSMTMMIVFSTPWFGAQEGQDFERTMFSLRLGVLLIAAAPLTLSVVQRQRDELLHRLERAANHDALTGILSRTALEERFVRALASLAEERSPLAFLMLDIDRFKAVNDRFGHPVGDQVLAAFATAIEACLRAGDLFGRLGGEEFCILLPRTGEAEAIAVAERLRSSVAALRPPAANGEEVAFTVSIGLVTVRGDAQVRDWLRLLRVADVALYRAKADGRDRVVSVRGLESDGQVDLSQPVHPN